MTAPLKPYLVVWTKVVHARDAQEAEEFGYDDQPEMASEIVEIADEDADWHIVVEST